MKQTGVRRSALLVLLLWNGCSSPNRPPHAAEAPASSVPASTSVRVQEPAKAEAEPCLQPEAEANCRDGACWIAPGCFTMGVPRDEVFASAKSDRQVPVRLTRGFWMQQTEVSVAQWTAAGLPKPNANWTYTGSKQADVPAEGYGICESDKCPVLWVTFEDAAFYANLRSAAIGAEPCYELSACEREAGRHLRCRSVRVRAASVYACEGYRLPTEAEWEYAARAGTDSAFYSGAITPGLDESLDCQPDINLDAIGWYCGNSSIGERKALQAHEVGLKQANGFGLYDMSGNAFEWTNDLYNPVGYGDVPLTDPIGCLIDPTDLTPEKHPVTGAYAETDGFPGYRVSRGGSYDMWSVMAMSGHRNELGALGGQFNGFRLVRTAAKSSP